MISLVDLLGPQITGTIVLPAQVEVARGGLMVLSEMCGRDVEMVQDLEFLLTRSDYDDSNKEKKTKYC